MNEKKDTRTQTMRNQRKLIEDERNLLLIFMGRLNFFDLTELESINILLCVDFIGI